MKHEYRPWGTVVLVVVFACASVSRAEQPSTRAAEPFDKEGLVLWLDADDAVVRDGTVVLIRDHGGRGNDAKRDPGAKDVRDNPAVVPIAPGGPPVLRFNGKYASFTFDRVSDVRTVFWVVSKNPAAFKQKQELFVLGDSKSLDFHPGTHFTDTILNSGPYGSRHLREGKAWLNGNLIDGRKTDFPKQLGVITLAATGNLEANQLAKDRAFPDRCWNGDIAEVLLFNKPLPEEQRRAVEAHLMRKYRIGPEAPGK